MTRRTLVAALLLMFTSVLLHAHGGMIHVMGTVTRVTDTAVTVETTEKKTVEVFLTATTIFLNGSKPCSRKELKVGDRVVIHAVKEKDALQAHEVRFGQTRAASTN